MITLKNAAAISAENIAELRPETRAKVQRWYDQCFDAGILVYVYEGHRTCERQNLLFAQGRTRKGIKVTNARGGQSMHQYGLAVDFVPLKMHPKASGMYEADWDNEKMYERAHEIANNCGLRRLSWETPHLEDASIANWKEARNRFGDPCK